MSTLNLYPYNLYILYAAIAAVVIYAIILVTHLLKLGKTVSAHQSEFASIQVNTARAADKITVMSNKSKKEKAKRKEMLPLVMLLMSIRNNYKANMNYESSTPKGKRSAAAKAIAQSSSDPRIMQQLKSTIGM